MPISAIIENGTPNSNRASVAPIPAEGSVDYTTVIDLALDTINASVAGPKRPQDRIELSSLDDRFIELFTKSAVDGGYGKTEADLEKRYPVTMGTSNASVTAGGGEQSSKTLPESIHNTTSPDNTNVHTEIEMMKGIEGLGYYDRLVVPIIENTARERELTDRMAAAIQAHPTTTAVLVRRHGVYVWGRDWVHAKTQADAAAPLNVVESDSQSLHEASDARRPRAPWTASASSWPTRRTSCARR